MLGSEFYELSYWIQFVTKCFNMIVDLSFMNSVTGSYLVSKCSNILQDRVNFFQSFGHPAFGSTLKYKTKLTTFETNGLASFSLATRSKKKSLISRTPDWSRIQHRRGTFKRYNFGVNRYVFCATCTRMSIYSCNLRPW